MTLSDLHAAIKPQFVWAAHDSKDLQTDPLIYKGEGSKSIASIVFIGIAFMNGYKAKEITEYLNLGCGGRGTRTYEEFNHKLSLFKKAMQAIKAGTNDKQANAIHLKTCLTLNYLKNHKRVSFVPLTTFKF